MRWALLEFLGQAMRCVVIKARSCALRPALLLLSLLHIHGTGPAALQSFGQGRASRKDWAMAGEVGPAEHGVL